MISLGECVAGYMVFSLERALGTFCCRRREVFSGVCAGVSEQGVIFVSERK